MGVGTDLKRSGNDTGRGYIEKYPEPFLMKLKKNSVISRNWLRSGVA